MLAVQVGQAHALLAGETVAAVYDDGQALMGYGHELEVFVFRAQGAEDEVVGVVFEPLCKCFRKALRHMDYRAPAVFGTELFDQVGEEYVLDRIHGTDRNGARVLAGFVLGERFAFADGHEGLLGVAVEFGPVFGEAHVAAVAHEKGNAQLVFQSGNRVRQGGLSDIELFGCARVVL